MSYSSDVKDNIIKGHYKNSCCRRNLLFGMIFSKGLIENNFMVLPLGDKKICEFACRLVGEFYPTSGELVSSAGGKSCKAIFKNDSLKNIFTAQVAEKNAIEFHFKCQGCKSSAMRGIFLACGKISDPNKQFCLEFTLGNRINLFFEYFNNIGLEFLSSARNTSGRRTSFLYTKRSSVIEDFFGIASLESVTYDVINSTIERSVNNHTNRCKNVEFTNIERSVIASEEQSEIIRQLKDRGLFGELPQELISTAQLRLDNPGASLSYLARVSNPPLTKSGISHRLNKIMTIAKELLSK